MAVGLSPGTRLCFVFERLDIPGGHGSGALKSGKAIITPAINEPSCFFRSRARDPPLFNMLLGYTHRFAARTEFRHRYIWELSHNGRTTGRCAAQQETG